MSDNQNLNATITLQPNITVGQITTVAEKVLEKLFSEYDTVLESENPISDKKQFFTMRTNTVKMLLSPIKAVRELKTPLTLNFEFNNETGILRMSSATRPEKQ